QLILVIKNADIIPEIQKYYLKYGGKLIIQGLILFFMFSQPVIKFFALENMTKAKLFLTLVAAAAVLFLIFYLL
ncbi:MAG: hypothetical protein KDI92_10470, partial [Xanthomonadales bacterium]|nr:hypothetical protein [Xanthomonadales bacterium]